MTRTRQTVVALSIVFIAIFGNPLMLTAQYAEVVDTGTVMNDITFKDISGKEFTLYSYLDEGYTVVIELALTTCPICWRFSQSGVFDRLYDNYGPAGQINPKKVLPIFIECNTGTTDEDLRGTGNMTEGDWVTGHSYPIVDLTSYEVLANFYKPGTIAITTPTFLIICPDRKVVYTGSGQTGAVNELMVKNYVEGECSSGVGVERVRNLINEESVLLYPNPVDDRLNIQIESMENTQATLSFTNLLGQIVQQEEVVLEPGEYVWSMATDRLTKGFYFLSVITDQGTIVRQFVKE